MLDAVRETVRRYAMLKSGNKVAAGVSGGPDSVAMLHLLLQLRDEFALNITAAHVNHRLRGEESDGDERFVAALCEKWNVPLRLMSADVSKLSKEQGLTLEEAGRQCRYALFNAVAGETGADKIAVAHHLNDSAETVLLNLCRGSGLAGLCGIPPVRGVPEAGYQIIRPLIERTRIEIEQYLHTNGIPFRTDATNLTGEFSRGRVRHNILPALTADVNRHATENIARNAALLRDENDFLEAETEKVFAAACGIPPCDTQRACGVPLAIPVLLNAHIAVTRRVIRRAYGLCAGTVKDLSALHAEQALDILRGHSGRSCSLPGGVTVRREYGRLIFTAAPGADAGFSFLLKANIPLRIPSTNKTVTMSLDNTVNACTKAFRYDRVSGALLLRTRLPGDRITLKGTGTRKLQDYFTDKKVPRPLRNTVPLFADGPEILWIMDDANRVNENYIPKENEKIFYVTLTNIL